MKLLEINNEGDMIFNWFALPEPLKSNEKERDKLLGELKDKFGANPINPRMLFDINKFALDRLKSIK